MRHVGLLVCVLATTFAQAIAQVQSQSANEKPNTLPLKNDHPEMFLDIPSRPLDSYEAYCSTIPMLCLVKGDGVIASGTPCHCGDYAGTTW
jgi:hypothetical protein